MLPLIAMASCGEGITVDNQLPSQGTNTQNKSFKILIVGDSLTEGYGVSESEAYPFILEKKLNLESKGGLNKNFQVINGGISGATTSGGVSRINWLLRSNPDYLILALGGNDGLRGIPIEKIKENLSEIVVAAQKNNIPILLAGMKIPPNYGLEYSDSFTNLYSQVSREYNISLIPFLLEGVGGEPSMNLPDRIHPNPKGHEIIAKTVHEHLLKELSTIQ
ncbi:MAG: arylesterase [Opitutales bacterium]|nr:arylesterase [Opitutales bacterium]